MLTKRILYVGALCLQFEKHRPNKSKCGFLLFEKLKKLYFIIWTLNYGKMMVFPKVSQHLVRLFTGKVKLKYGFLNNILQVLSNKALYFLAV